VLFRGSAQNATLFDETSVSSKSSSASPGKAAWNVDCAVVNVVSQHWIVAHMEPRPRHDPPAAVHASTVRFWHDVFWKQQAAAESEQSVAAQLVPEPCEVPPCAAQFTGARS
jgi:hypothetical protein